MNNRIDKNECEDFADSNDIYILLKWGFILKCYEGCKISKGAI